MDTCQPSCRPRSRLLTAATVIALVYLLILAVGMMSSGFSGAAGGQAAAARLLEHWCRNPMAALMIGIFATALVQSSSTVTSIVVGLVASGLPVGFAIPIILGANIGTAITSTLVSMTFITRPQEFHRAFAASTVHSIFNVMAAVLFLVVELVIAWVSPSGQGPLAMLSDMLTRFLLGGADVADGIKSANFIKPLIDPVVALFYHPRSGSGLLITLFGVRWGGVVLSLAALGLIFTSIIRLGSILKANLIGRAERLFNTAIGRGPVTGMASGAIMTILVQSSSTTTSLIIPMAGAGVVRMEKVFPFTLGANIGTTVTGLLASMAGGENPDLSHAALQIALIHTLFNILGVVVIYGLPFLRILPIRSARYLAEVCTRRRSLAFVYLIGLYFVLPLILLAISALLTPSATSDIEPSPALEYHDPHQPPEE